MSDRVARRPRLVGWGITERCNLSCPHCYSSASKASRRELTTAECCALIDALAGMGAERIGWTGGEPLLRLDLERLIARAAGHGIESALTTNGVPMTPRRARSLKDAGLTAIQISLDGSTADRNTRVRCASSAAFDRVIRAIAVSREAGLTVHMAMLAGGETLDDVRDYVDLAGRMGAATVRLCGFVPWGGGSDQDVRDRLDLRGRLQELRSLVEDLRDREFPLVLFDPGFGPLPPDFAYHECIAGMEMIYIGPEGDVYPCTSLIDWRFRVGNVHQRSIEEMWADPRMTSIARFPAEAITGPCRECDAFAACRGACRGIAHAYTGDLYASFPLCLKRAATPCVRPAVVGK